MKRFRIFGFHLDRRALILEHEEQAHWNARDRAQHRQNRQQLLDELACEFGSDFAEQKLQSFADLGAKPISIFAFHNRFLDQIRTAFVMGAYYPALTAACALGERILNYLILQLRHDYKGTPEYKALHRKDSFDNWDMAIRTLEAWEVLLPAVASEFKNLRDRRNDAIHFRPEVDTNDRELALAAVKNLEVILENQFSGFGSQPWFITEIPGEIYIKKHWEEKPFVKRVYLPNCVHVGPQHRIESVLPWKISDCEYASKEITDDEFVMLRTEANAQHVAEIERAATKPKPGRTE